MNLYPSRIAFLFLAAFPILTLQAEDWPRFRGPNGDGTSAAEDTPIKWNDTENVKWRIDLPGKGFSSPIVVGDKVFVTAYSGSRARSPGS